MKRLLLAAVGLGALGCVPPEQQVGYRPIELIPTRTPGVAFVVVSPRMPKQPSGISQPGDGSAVSAASQYVMLCDARPVEGMQCSLIQEASTDRFSYTPATGNAPAPVSEGVGTLTSVIRVDQEGACVAGDELREAAQAAPPPPPPPPPAPARVPAPQPVVPPPAAPAAAPAAQPTGVQP